MFNLKLPNTPLNFPFVIETSQHFIVNGKFYKKTDFTLDDSLYLDTTVFIAESFPSISIRQTIEIPRMEASMADRGFNYKNIHYYVSKLDPNIEYVFVDSIKTAYYYFITINYKNKIVNSVRLIDTSAPKRIAEIIDETPTSLIAMVHRAPFANTSPTTQYQGGICSFAEILKGSGMYNGYVYKDDPNGYTITKANMIKAYETPTTRNFVALRSYGTAVYADHRCEVSKTSQNPNYTIAASPTIKASALYCAFYDPYIVEDENSAVLTFFNPTIEGLVPTKLTYLKSSFNNINYVPTLSEKTPIGSVFVGQVVSTGAEIHYNQNLRKLEETSEKIVFLLTLNCTVNRAKLDANAVDLVNFKRNTGFNIIEYNKTNDTYSIIQEVRFNELSMGVLILEDLSKLIFLSDTGISFYNRGLGLNTYSLVYKKVGLFPMIGLDSFNRVWTLSEQKDIELLSTTLVERMEIEFKDKDTLNYKGVNLPCKLKVNAYNSMGSKISANLKLMLKGTIQFVDGSQSKDITTLVDSDLLVDVVITGSGLINAFVILESDLSGN